MTIYIIIALCLLSFALLSEYGYFKNSRTAKAAFLSAGSLILFFVSAFRYDVGDDFRPYTNNFIRLARMTNAELATERMEKGYIFLNRYIQLFVNDFQMLFIMISLIVILLVFAILLKFCKNPSMGLLIFYLYGLYFNSMNFMRNVIAGLIIVFAYQYIKEKNLMKFAVIVLLASTFHISALVFLPFYFIFRLKFNYITVIIYSIFCGALFIFSQPIMEFVTTYVYTSYGPLTSREMFNGIPVIYSLCSLTFLVCGMLLRKDLEKDSDMTSLMLSAAYMKFCFGFLGSKHAILSRFSLYFGPVMSLILIPDIIRVSYSNIKNKSNKGRSWFCLIGTCGSLIVFFVYALATNYNKIMPHEWIWNVI